MTAIVTFHAPVVSGQYWLLRADIGIGPDTVVLTAKLSPATITWARQQALRGANWALQLASAAKQKLDRYVQFKTKGDWSALGLLGDIASRVVTEVANHGALDGYEDMRGAVNLFAAVQGEQGIDSQYKAGERVDRILADAEQGITKAIEAKRTLEAVSTASAILSAPSPESYFTINELIRQSDAGNESAKLLLQACKALGMQAVNQEPINVAYDIEQAITADHLAGEIGSYASNALVYRGIKPQLSMGQVSREFSRALQYGRRMRTRDRLSGYPNSSHAGYIEDPDQLDYRGSEWGYGWGFWR
jgi:hypothetical protein